MADRLIVMTKANVLNLLAKRKFRTMRVIKPQPEYEKSRDIYWWKGDWDTRGGPRAGICTHGSAGNGEPTWTLKEITEYAPIQVGDRLLVAEGYQILDTNMQNPAIPKIKGIYLADKKKFEVELTDHEWKLWCERNFPYRPTSGRFMYKSLARISMVVTDVAVQRPRDLRWYECRDEGVYLVGDELVFNNRKQKQSLLKTKFKRLYISVYGEEKWKQNLWHFVYKWKEIEIK